ncbi:hypothetical protein DP56_5626 [Burkholderia pseudomallei]|nr:hypothetical protein DP56_5626 [Burkholderia pseudomallei]
MRARPHRPAITITSTRKNPRNRRARTRCDPYGSGERAHAASSASRRARPAFGHAAGMQPRRGTTYAGAPRMASRAVAPLAPRLRLNPARTRLEPGLKPSRAGLGARLEIALCGSRPRTEVAARYGARTLSSLACAAIFTRTIAPIASSVRLTVAMRAQRTERPRRHPADPGLAPAGRPRPTARRACGRTPARFRRCAGTPADIRQTPVGTCPRTPRT